MLIEIKQIAIDNPNQSKYTNNKYGEFTMEPLASRSYRVKRGTNKRFVTGLSAEQEQRLGKVIGEDLSDLSDFWSKTFRMKFDLSTGSMALDTEDPYSEIFISAAKANKLLADDKDSLLDDVLLKRETIFYINNQEEQEKKKVSLLELKDEISSLIFKYKNNRDRLFWTLHKIGEFVTKQFKEESLYRMISAYRDKLSTREKLENFRDILKLSSVELQAGYYVKEGMSKGIISIDGETNHFKYLDKIVGKRTQEIVEFFSDKKNEALLATLINEVNDI